MSITLTYLQANFDIEGQTTVCEPKSKLANLISHPGTIIGDPESIVHIDWLSQLGQIEKA